jgi:hypothetical protein
LQGGIAPSKTSVLCAGFFSSQAHAEKLQSRLGKIAKLIFKN